MNELQGPIEEPPISREYPTSTVLEWAIDLIMVEGWDGKVELGVTFYDDQASQTGPLCVQHVNEGSAGYYLGLRPGDILLAINSNFLAGCTRDEVLRKQAEGFLRGPVDLSFHRPSILKPEDEAFIQANAKMAQDLLKGIKTEMPKPPQVKPVAQLPDKVIDPRNTSLVVAAVDSFVPLNKASLHLDVPDGGSSIDADRRQRHRGIRDDSISTRNNDSATSTRKGFWGGSLRNKKKEATKTLDSFAPPPPKKIPKRNRRIFSYFF